MAGMKWRNLHTQLNIDLQKCNDAQRKFPLKWWMQLVQENERNFSVRDVQMIFSKIQEEQGGQAYDER